MSFIVQVFSVLWAISALLMFGAFVVGVGSNNRYTEQSCEAVIAVGFIMFVLFGGLALVLR